MGDDSKGAGEYGGANKVTGDDVQCGSTVIASVWERNLGDHRCDDDVTEVFP